MYAIAFDMVITDLRANYGEPYNNAYFEINKVLRQYEFYNTQGSVYLTEKTDMANLFRAIDALKRIPWFQASVRDLRAFRVEDWSNFTDFIKENKSEGERTPSAFSRSAIPCWLIPSSFQRKISRL